MIAAMAIAATCLGIETAVALADPPQGSPITPRAKRSYVMCEPFTKEALPKPTAQSDAHAAERFKAINMAVRSTSSAIQFFGDSLTEQWDPAVWQKYLAHRGALNAGVNGDRTENLLWRLQNGNLDGPSPKLVVLLIGTNDVSKNRSAEVIAEGIRANLKLLHSRYVTSRILIVGLLPRSHLPSDSRREQIRDVNDLIRQCANDKRIFFADVGGALLKDGGKLPPEISSDGVHLSPLGYAVLSKRLEPELNRALLGSGP